MARSATIRKEKKTFSLSEEAVKYLEVVRRQERKSSSQVLEELIQASKLSAEQRRISESMRRYYDSLDAEGRAENRMWGELSESQFPRE